MSSILLTYLHKAALFGTILIPLSGIPIMALSIILTTVLFGWVFLKNGFWAALFAEFTMGLTSTLCLNLYTRISPTGMIMIAASTLALVLLAIWYKERNSSS